MLIDLYGNLPLISDVIKSRRMRIAGHCVRHQEEIASRLILWKPKHGRPNRGRQPTTFTDMLLKDTEADNLGELKTMMLDREDWKKKVETSFRAGARLK